jgi:carbon monoxide dehydrogenase subunit G
MRTGGSVQLDAPAQSLWTRLSDPRALEAALPAVESVELLSADRFAARVEPATGLGATPLNLEVTIADAREGEHVRLTGTGDGPEFATTFAVELDLSEHGSATEVRWSAEARFNGVLSSLGQRVLPAILAAQVERVLRAAADGAAQPAPA